MVALPARWSRQGRPLDLRSIHRAVEIALAVLIGIQLARLIWILIGFPGGFGAPPRVAPHAAPAVDLSVLERFDPFFRGQEALSGEGGLEGYTLYGVRVGPLGSSAIIAGPDGVQTSYGVGDQVGAGVTLREVTPDYVVLSTGGTDVQLGFPAFAAAPDAAMASAASVAPPPIQAAAPDPTRAVGAARLEPRVRGGRVLGAVLVQPNEALSRAGLQAGDVVIAVDGQTLEDPESIEDFGARVAQPVDAEIRYERGGQAASVRLRR